MESRSREVPQRRRWSAVLTCAATALCATTVACTDSLPNVPRRAAPPAKTINGSADDDKTMGNLSEIARHVSAALEDPRVRGALVRAMKDSVNNPAGVDLTECSGGSIAENLLRAAELRGGRDASTLCNDLRVGKGAMLFMDRSRLAGWDSTTIPVVTAIANPDAPIAKSFHGYRSPDLVMDVKADGSVGGPVLVIVPYANPHRASGRSTQPLGSQSVSPAREAPRRARAGVAP
jgi:hypothetical protein